MEELETIKDNPLNAVLNPISEVNFYPIHGRVLEVVGSIVKVLIKGVQLGELCTIVDKSGLSIEAEVVGFDDNIAVLAPFGPVAGASVKSVVIPTGKKHSIKVGEHLIGQVLNGLGQPFVDGAFNPNLGEFKEVKEEPPSAMSRPTINKAFPMGVRAIDSLITCAEGQRVGVFAAAGCGKSTLLSMFVMTAKADVIILALIGERGREVREFIEHDLGPEGMKKCIVVVSTSDNSSLERAKAAEVATAVAEYFRNKGKKVLFLMDSVTRYARALREIGLAAGEPPARRGFPPSVFANLPKLLERTGMSPQGSITAFYTILVEGDDMNEPVADETRSLLDGHIILSRKLAESGHYPAIDVLKSVSRLITKIVDKNHLKNAEKLRSLLSKYQEVELLVQIGEYKKGADALADEAISKISKINEFLKQRIDEVVSFEDTINQMMRLAGA
jgi:type III secretion protein N (ATPase)